MRTQTNNDRERAIRVAPPKASVDSGGRPAESGQATTEYALILLVAAVIALLVLAWATSGDGGGRIGDLFDTVVGKVIQRADAGS